MNVGVVPAARTSECSDCREPMEWFTSWTTVDWTTEVSRIVCRRCYLDDIVMGALRSDCPPWGCCAACGGSGVSGDPDVPGGLCWDCRAGGHDHGVYGTALRVRWRP